MSASRIFNLKVHLKNCHQIEIPDNKNVQYKIEKKSIKTKIEINKFEIIRSYIGLITENSIAFDILNSVNMRNVLKPICSAICDKEDLFTLNSENANKIESSDKK